MKNMTIFCACGAMLLPAMAPLLAVDAVSAATTAEVVVNPKVLTSGYVDTTSVEGIVAGVTRGAKTDEEKVLAFYQWYRRMIFHHRLMGGDRRDILKVINSYGCDLCGSQAAMFVDLLQRAGFKTRVVAGSAPGDFGGHTFVEIFYDGKWHCFDTMTSFAVFTRDVPPHIASLEELKADATLVTLAAKEKRAVPGYLPCLDHQEHTAADKDALKKSMGAADFTWSTLLFTAGSLLDFWRQAPSAAKVLDNGGVYGSIYRPGVLDFTLKPNEELVREWDHAANKWYKTASHPDFGPHHTCGAADEFDTFNFPYFEPYLKENLGHTKKCYRWFGNGWLEWRPDAAKGEVAAAGKVAQLTTDATGALVVAGDAPGRLTIPVKCPYAGVGIELDLALKQSGIGSVTRVVLIEGSQEREVWKMEGDADGVQKIVVAHENSPLFEYALRIEGRRGAAGAVTFTPLRLRTIFQENIYALPGLLPGRNTVTVSAMGPVQLAAGALVVSYEWAEGNGWKTAKSATRKLTELPATFEVDVEGPKLPRMKRLVVRLEPKTGAPQRVPGSAAP